MAVTMYICSHCDAQLPKWSGRCFECGSWGTLKEGVVAKKTKTQVAGPVAAPIYNFNQLSESQASRIAVGSFPGVKVFPQGLAQGALILLSGEPGAGKSTLALQLANNFSQGAKVLYFSAEESAVQLKERGRRLGTFGPNFFISESPSVESIIATIAAEKPKVVFIDSIQLIATDDETAESGTVGAVKLVAGKLSAAAREHQVAIIIIGHVTKDGSIAGPKSLEHVVDAVYLLAGDPATKYRLLRSLKNRFGPSGSVVVMQLASSGFHEVTDAARIFIEHFKAKVGSALTIAVIGDQMFFLEVQSLVVKSNFGYAKRTTSGFPQKRLEVILAIMKKNLDLNLDAYDVYINIAGGFQVSEPAMDLAVALSLLSSLYNKPLPESMVVFGELGLSAELRLVKDTSLRLKEIESNKFTTVILPPLGKKISSRSRLSPAVNLREVLQTLKW